MSPVGPGRPGGAGPKKTPTPTEVLRSSSDDLRPFLESVVKTEGDLESKLFVLAAQTLEQVRGVGRDVGRLHARIERLEDKVEASHCLKEAELVSLDEALGNVQLEQSAAGRLADKMDERLQRLEERDVRSRRWWQSLFGIFGLALVTSVLGGTWWLADHSATDTQDHIQINETKLLVQALDVAVHQKAEPSIRVLEDRVERHAVRLTMLEEAPAPVVKFPRHR